jgi:hypothetical protein
VSTTGSTTESSSTTGIGGTVIRTAISKSRQRAERLKHAGRQRAASSRLIFPGQSARSDTGICGVQARRKAVARCCSAACLRVRGKPGANTSCVAAEPSALKRRADLAFRSARAAGLQFLRNLFSPFHTSLPLLMSRPLFVLLCLAAPAIAAGQNLD